MNTLYRINLFNSSVVNFISVSGIAKLLSSEFISSVARECGLMVRERKFDIMAFVRGMLGFCAKSSSAPQYTINNFYLNYYLPNADEKLCSKPFHNQLRKGALVTFMETLVLRLSEFLGNANPMASHRRLVEILNRAAGITDIVTIDGSHVFVNPSCRKHFPCKTCGRKRTQRGLVKDNAGLKLHAGFSNRMGRISHLDITEAVGSERDHVNPDDYPAGVCFVALSGYVDYAMEDGYNRRGQYFIVRYKENFKGEITCALDGKTGEPLNGMRCMAPTDPALARYQNEIVDMSVARADGSEVRVIRVANPEGGFAYYGTNLGRRQVDATAIYLIYRSRWLGSEHTFKALKSGDGLQSINSSIKEIILTFMLGNLLCYLLKQIIATHMLKQRETEGYEFSILRIHTGMTLPAEIIKALIGGSISTLSRKIKKFAEVIISACGRIPASERDKSLLKDFPTLVDQVNELQERLARCKNA